MANVSGIKNFRILTQKQRHGKREDSFCKLREISKLLTEVFVEQEAQLDWLYGSVPMLRRQ